MLEFCRRWRIFLQERFCWGENLPVIFLYFLANALVALKAARYSGTGWKVWLVAGFITWLIFLHLRIFDDIKDAVSDRSAHPKRPLPRGLISLPEAGGTAFFLPALEIVLASLLGSKPLLALLPVTCYSLLMYREFFIGKWLRPHLTTYAVTHTLVSCFIALFIFSAVTGFSYSALPLPCWIFLPVNWMLFNLFEFARKTFSPPEENPLVPSYSNRFGAWGSALLSVSTAGLSVYPAFWLGKLWQLSSQFFWGLGILLGLFCLSALLYALIPRPFYARTFRLLGSAFLLFYNLLIVVFLGGGILWKS